ncbi:MAG: hypothetical protein IKN55_08020 [Oscillospiraceae bacterium]|nr:hypothetical protein [Oscillospiraceae bacterium]
MHRNSLLGASPAASFLYNLTKNLAAHLHHQLCAVLPIEKNTFAGGETCKVSEPLDWSSRKSLTRSITS